MSVRLSLLESHKITGRIKFKTFTKLTELPMSNKGLLPYGLFHRSYDDISQLSLVVYLFHNLNFIVIMGVELQVIIFYIYNFSSIFL